MVDTGSFQMFLVLLSAVAGLKLVWWGWRLG